MVWSASSGKDGVIQRAFFLAFGDSQDHTTAWPLADVTASANRWVQTLSLMIWRATGIWEIDDKNQSDLNQATATLVSGQNDYALPTTIFKVARVEVQDQNANWHVLEQKEMKEIQYALPSFYNQNGLPQFYRLAANSLWLYPAPDAGISVTLVAGIRLYFTRQFLGFSVPASYTTSDTTNPGFDEQFCDMLCTGMASDWCLANGPADRADRLEKRLTAFSDQMYQHYGVKDRDKKAAFRPRYETYI